MINGKNKMHLGRRRQKFKVGLGLRVPILLDCGCRRAARKRTTALGPTLSAPSPPTTPRPTRVRPTFPVAAEAISFDNLLLDLCGHGQHELQHLAHVVARIVSSLIHAHGVLRSRKRLDHLRQDHYAQDASQGGVPGWAPGHRGGPSKQRREEGGELVNRGH